MHCLYYSPRLTRDQVATQPQPTHPPTQLHAHHRPVSHPPRCPVGRLAVSAAGPIGKDAPSSTDGVRVTTAVALNPPVSPPRLPVSPSPPRPPTPCPLRRTRIVSSLALPHGAASTITRAPLSLGAIVQPCANRLPVSPSPRLPANRGTRSPSIPGHRLAHSLVLPTRPPSSLPSLSGGGLCGDLCRLS